MEMDGGGRQGYGDDEAETEKIPSVHPSRTRYIHITTQKTLEWHELIGF